MDVNTYRNLITGEKIPYLTHWSSRFMSNAVGIQPSIYDLKSSLQVDNTQVCPVCGHSGVSQQKILWAELIEAWGLSAEESALIDRQQGEQCSHCNCNLRSRTLAGALCECLDWEGSLIEMLYSNKIFTASMLEINEAGNLHGILQQWPEYTFAAYPQVDMQDLPYDEGQYDFVIHSDTLENVPNPIKALCECRRILKPNGCMIMTMPIIPARLTRRRHGLEPSYHSQTGAAADDMKVITEDGADFYLDLIQAGWRKFSMYTLGSFASLAVIGIK